MTPDEAARQYEQLTQVIIGSIKFAEVAALNEINGKMKRRVHNKGVTADGSQIGQYTSESYKKRRRKAKKQVDFIDLELTGDLRTGYVVGEVSETGETALGFPDHDEALKAGHQNDRYGRVFVASLKEMNEATASYNAVLNQHIKDGAAKIK